MTAAKVNNKNDDDDDDLNYNDVIVVYTTQRNMTLPFNACRSKLALGRIEARLLHLRRDLSTWHKHAKYVHVLNKTKPKTDHTVGIIPNPTEKR